MEKSEVKIVEMDLMDWIGSILALKSNTNTVQHGISWQRHRSSKQVNNTSNTIGMYLSDPCWVFTTVQLPYSYRYNLCNRISRYLLFDSYRI